MRVCKCVLRGEETHNHFKGDKAGSVGGDGAENTGEEAGIEASPPARRHHVSSCCYHAAIFWWRHVLCRLDPVLDYGQRENNAPVTHTCN
jgi:hypothetical protein